MKKLNLLALFFILMQSCQVYKPVSISEIEKGKTYDITLKNGQSIEGKCEKVNDKSILVIINENILELSKSKIDKAKKRKVSNFRLLGGLTVATAGIIVLITSINKEGEKEKITN